jgi:hypothetical protein
MATTSRTGERSPKSVQTSLEPHSEGLFFNYGITLISIMEAEGLKQREVT